MSNLFSYAIPPSLQRPQGTPARLGFKRKHDDLLRASSTLLPKGFGASFRPEIPKDDAALPTELRQLRRVALTFSSTLAYPGYLKIRSLDLVVRRHPGWLPGLTERFSAELSLTFHDSPLRMQVGGVAAGTLSHLLNKALHCEVAVRARNSSLVGQPDASGLLSNT